MHLVHLVMSQVTARCIRALELGAVTTVRLSIELAQQQPAALMLMVYQWKLILEVPVTFNLLRHILVIFLYMYKLEVPKQILDPVQVTKVACRDQASLSMVQILPLLEALGEHALGIVEYGRYHPCIYKLDSKLF